MPSDELSAWVREQYAEAGRLPEFEHLARVAKLARSRPDQAVAWLHDIAEDDIATLAEIKTALERSSDFAAEDIYSIVASVELLKRQKANEEPYTVYIERVIESADARALRVKQLDLIDHLDPYLRHTLRPDQAARYLSALEAIIQSTLAHPS